MLLERSVHRQPFWASKNTPDIQEQKPQGTNYVDEGKGGGVPNDVITMPTPYKGLSDYEKEVATKEKAVYYIDEDGRVTDLEEGEIVPYHALSAED